MLRGGIEECPSNSHTNRQFNDPTIWETLSDFAKLKDLEFVTRDIPFFEDGKPDRGTAKHLHTIRGKSLTPYGNFINEKVTLKILARRFRRSIPGALRTGGKHLSQAVLEQICFIACRLHGTT